MPPHDNSENAINRVLVVLAHPDDPEFFCGGTVAKWVDEGREVHYCLLTRGDKGSDDLGVDPEPLAQQRIAEQRAAGRILGVKTIRFLDYPDGYLEPTLELRKEVVRVIRQIQPDAVITCDPTNFFPSDRYINHPDHRAAGQVTLDAVFPASRSALYFPELLEEGLQPHKVHHVYVSSPVHPNTFIDITGYFEQKLAAIKAHNSQIPDIEGMESRLRERLLDPASPPDSPRYIESYKRIELR